MELSFHENVLTGFIIISLIAGWLFSILSSFLIFSWLLFKFKPTGYAVSLWFNGDYFGGATVEYWNPIIVFITFLLPGVVFSVMTVITIVVLRANLRGRKEIFRE